MGEIAYQGALIKKLEKLFPGCFVMKNGPMGIQGLPDLLILFKNTWAFLEVKVSEKAPSQPNQPHYIEKFGKMAFAAFIYPENEERVLNDLQSAFGLARKARVSKSK